MIVNKTADLASVLLDALSGYVRGRAEEIVSRHILESKKEIEKSVYEEVSKTVLSVHNMVSFKDDGHEIVFTVRKESGVGGIP